MEMSDTIGELAGALVEAQKEMPSILKDKVAKGVKFSYAYVGLDSVMPAALAVLTKHGLSIVQPVGRADDGSGVVTTMLLHASGEYIADTQPLLLERNDPQGQGSAITYARRYGLMSMIGLVADDDDDATLASAQPAVRRIPEGNGTDERPTAQDGKRMEARYKSECYECGNPIAVGERIIYFSASKRAKHDAPCTGAIPAEYA